MIYNQIHNEWLSYIKENIKYSSYTKYKSAFHVYIEGYLKDNPLETLNEDKMQTYINELVNKDIAYTRVKFIKIVFKSLYQYCEKDYGYRHIDFSTINIDSSKKTDNQFITLNQADENVIYEYCINEMEPVRLAILLALYMGLRMSEICALKYSDIHFEKQSISIQRYVQRTDTGHSDDELEIESWAARREVFIPDFLFEYIKAYKECYFVNEEMYLLTNRKKYMKPRTIQRSINQISDELGINFTLGNLRNIFQKKCIESGMNIYTVLSIMGRSVIKIEMNENMKTDIKTQQIEMNKIGI